MHAEVWKDLSPIVRHLEATSVFWNVLNSKKGEGRWEWRRRDYYLEEHFWTWFRIYEISRHGKPKTRCFTTDFLCFLYLRGILIVIVLFHFLSLSNDWFKYLLAHYGKFPFLTMLVGKFHNNWTTKALNSISILFSILSFRSNGDSIQALSQYFHMTLLFPGTLPWRFMILAQAL